MIVVEGMFGINRRRWLGGLLAMGWGGVFAPGRAAQESQQLQARYDVYAAGLKVAEVELVQDLGSKGVQSIRFFMQNKGFAALFGGRHRLSMTTQFAADGSMRPTSFVSHSKKPDRERRVIIDYADGVPVDVKVDNDGRVRGSEVPMQDWQNAVDPLTALAQMQAWFISAKTDDNLHLPLFDGRKRADLIVHKTAADQVIDLQIIGVHGFERNEDQYVSWPGETPKILNLTYDRGTPPVPLLLQSSSTSWSTELRLEERQMKQI